MTTGELEQTMQLLQKQLSGQHEKICGIEKSLGTGGVIMQVKSELGKEYLEIIEKANGGLSNQISWTNGLISVVSILLPIAVAGIGFRFKNKFDHLLNQVNEKEKKIENIQVKINDNAKIVGEQKGLILRTNNILEKHVLRAEKNIKEIKEIEYNIQTQDSRIYELVNKSLINGWFLRLNKDVDDRDNLQTHIFTSDEKYISGNGDYYNILLKIISKDITVYGCIYQFFSEKLFSDKKIADRIGNIDSGFKNFSSEIITGSNKIFEFYMKCNKLEYRDELKKYIQCIYTKIITNNIRGYSSIEIQELKELLDDKTLEVGESLMREEIKNPPVQEVNEPAITILDNQSQ